MAANAQTYKQVRTTVARMTGLLMAEGTVAAATLSTVNSRDLMHQRADQLKGGWVYFNGGSHAGQEFPIYAFTPVSPGNYGSGGRVDILSSFGYAAPSAAPSTNSTFEVYRTVKPSVLNDAIKQVVRGAALAFILPVTNTSISLVPTQFAYNLPADLAWVRSLHLETGVSTGKYYDEEIDHDLWWIDGGPATPTLNFWPERVYLLENHRILVRGQQYATEPSAEGDTLEVDPQYVAYKTAESILRYLPWSAEDLKGWQAKHAAMKEDAERALRASPRPFPGSRRVREY